MRAWQSGRERVENRVVSNVFAMAAAVHPQPRKARRQTKVQTKHAQKGTISPFVHLRSMTYVPTNKLN